MRVRFALGLFRIWVVLSVLWLAGVGTYTYLAYQGAPLPDLKRPVLFDDLIPAYEHCWDYRTSDGQKVDVSKFSNEALAQVAECEREADRWLILRSGVLFALGVPIIIFGFGWGFVWAFRGFLPATDKVSRACPQAVRLALGDHRAEHSDQQPHRLI
jgi:hypothetical protein